ncbi:hypothetical protein Lal_00023903 [Lupinus albus]|nr:hypothetical protein Lal_00023903 [Lupinus albus]
MGVCNNGHLNPSVTIETYNFFYLFTEPITMFEKGKPLMISSYMIELQNLPDKYFTSKLNALWLKNLFLVARKWISYSRNLYHSPESPIERKKRGSVCDVFLTFYTG